MSYDLTPPHFSGDPLSGDSDSGDDHDVVLVESGREASDSEVMEHSALDFEGFHSRRSSVQFAQGHPLLSGGSGGVVGGLIDRPPSNSSLALAYANANANALVPGSEDAFGTVGSIPSVASAASLANGGASHGTGRFGARRASMPSNRLEM